MGSTSNLNSFSNWSGGVLHAIEQLNGNRGSYDIPFYATFSLNIVGGATVQRTVAGGPVSLTQSTYNVMWNYLEIPYT